MKRLYIHTLFVALCTTVSATAQQVTKTFNDGTVRITPVSFVQHGDSLYVDMTMDVTTGKMCSSKSVELMPSVTDGARIKELPAVLIKTKRNLKEYKRMLALAGKDKPAEPYAVIKATEKEYSISYKYAVKYETWMAGARLNVRTDDCGCGKRYSRGMEVFARAELQKEPVAYQPQIQIAYVTPEVEEIKMREVEFEAFLDFEVNKTDIRPDYMGNERELKRITSFIRGISADNALSIRSIAVTGYASPEGSYSGNKRLSEGRANALASYLVTQFDYPRDMYKVVFGGENWAGLKECVENSDMQYRQEVLDVIENVPSEIDYVRNISRRKAMMDLRGGEPYRYMLKEFFPSLRKAVCKVDFEVRHYTIEEAKIVARTNPQNLSLNEMFLVANTYEKGSGEYTELMETAVRLYPKDAVANINAASIALSQNNVVMADHYLNNVTVRARIPEYDNAKGVLEMLKGNYDAAERYLKAASEAGLSEAIHNLKELGKLVEDKNKK